MAEEKHISEETRGERLSRLRKAKRLSLEEVHQGTNIHIQVLKALEEDSVSKMAPAYVRGLLKIYCNFLGVDFKDFIEESTKKEDAPDSSTIKPPPSVAVIKRRLRLRPIVLFICLLLAAMAIFKLGRVISMLWISRLESKTDEVVVSKKEPSASVSMVTNPRLGIRARKNCWLEVKTDGKTVFKGILKKGRFEYWEAKEMIGFSLGNAGEVDVEVNGKLFPPLGRRGQVIKNIKITKDGLTVPK